MYSLPDEPSIANALRTGYPDGGYVEERRCPICDSDTFEFIYRNKKTGEIYGCDDCIDILDYWEFDEQYQDEDC